MLFVVSTPIGNLSEITQRALDVIKKSDAVVCEDTRVTLKLLNYYGINKQLIRYNYHSEKSTYYIVEMIESGKTLCLVTDAGTPCISDPGWKIVKVLREKGIRVEVVGINSAVIAAVAGSGFDGSRFAFAGFLPRSDSKRKKILSSYLNLRVPVVVYESATRLTETLKYVRENFGDIECVVARELTKIHEEWIYGTINEVIEKISLKKEFKGEISVVFYRTDISKISNIGFVCSGNTCRSVMAEAYAKKISKSSSFNFSSAGLYAFEDTEVPENVFKILEKEGISRFKHTPKQIDRSFIEANDLILTMTRDHKKRLIMLFPEYENKIYTFAEYAGENGDVYDPYAKDYIFYEMVFKQIKRYVDFLINKLAEKTG